eukprot:324422-Pleurochrysis_carterae.AAC.1
MSLRKPKRSTGSRSSIVERKVDAPVGSQQLGEMSSKVNAKKDKRTCLPKIWKKSSQEKLRRECSWLQSEAMNTKCLAMS